MDEFFTNGKERITRILIGDDHAVVLDITMPGTSGLRVASTGHGPWDGAAAEDEEWRLSRSHSC